MARPKATTARPAPAKRAANDTDRAVYTHNLWLNYLKPVSLGLVFSPNALRAAQVELPPNLSEAQKALEPLTTLLPLGDDEAPEESVRVLADSRAFLTEFLGWKPNLLEYYRPRANAHMFAGQAPAPGNELPEAPQALTHDMPQSSYNDVLEPSFAYRWNSAPADGRSPYCLVGLEVPHDVDIDRKPGDSAGHDTIWPESPQKKFERLLYETKIPLGLIFHGKGVRLVYRPETQQSGYISFPLDPLLKPAGRLACTALKSLLNHNRLQVLPSRQRLHTILAESRKYQSEVSTQLAEQVLAALFELLKGFESADEESRGRLLAGLRNRANRTHVIYEGLLTVLMRLVFLLYAEEREMFPADDLFVRNYSIAGLFARLVEDESRHPDTMDQRYGAWAQLCVLFRIVHAGVEYEDRSKPTDSRVKIPARRGDLFDPARFPFLEGRKTAEDAPLEPDNTADLPKVPDGTILNVLRNLLYLKDERLSYRTLEVEQIGSVYEAVMGYRVETATGRSLAIKPEKRHGAPVTIDLDDLLATSANKRADRFKKLTDRKLPTAAATAIRNAKTEADLVVALDRMIDRRLTPAPVPAGSLVIQPSPERRRTGSHYTPQTLTGPIVTKALMPILRRLGPNPTSEALLALKICDPAMGSGAFLVEMMRQLAKLLVDSWLYHGNLPRIPLDETPVLYASRLIAQRCLYGVDKNRMAVDLAKLSLWLATLAKDHAFTFLDHNFRHGDSLVGLSLAQIQACHWEQNLSGTIVLPTIARRIAETMKKRQEILNADEFTSYSKLSDLRLESDKPLDFVRFLGDAVLGVFFEGGTASAKERRRTDLSLTVRDYLSTTVDMTTQLLLRREIEQPVSVLHHLEPPLEPFHWEVEFPEVFLGTNSDGSLKRRDDGGFDVMMGNPPFAGKNTMAEGSPKAYPDWLKTVHPESHGNADLVAHFFRRAFNLIRPDGAFGLIATNTIGQGDTRSTGLRWICNHGGTIYEARKRLKWPGEAAVVVSVIHVEKTLLPPGEGGRRPDEGSPASAKMPSSAAARHLLPGGEGRDARPFLLDGREVSLITAFLFPSGGHDDPERLHANAGKSFQGTTVLGMGFTFDDTEKKGIANPVTRARADELAKSGERPMSMEELIEKDSRNRERILPYIGGKEINDSPTQAHHRYVVNFGQLSVAESRQWPQLFELVEKRVKPERMKNNREGYRKWWWQFGEKRIELYQSLHGLDRVMACSLIGKHFAFALLPNGMVYSHGTVVFPIRSTRTFSLIQSTIHAEWALFFGSTFEDRRIYTPTDCFVTFPFPAGWETNTELEAIGQEYYDYRAQLMRDTNLGLTKTYNRFHDPKEKSPEIRRLRELHTKMDRAVLASYGWSDIDTTCGFDVDWCEDEAADDASPETVERLETGRYFFESAEEARAFATELVSLGKGLPWRYRWRPEVRDEVLARLLLLNKERAEEERLAGLSPLSTGGPSGEDDDLEGEADGDEETDDGDDE